MSHGKIVREKRRLRAFKRMYDQGRMSEEDIWNCYQSWRGTVALDHNACYRTLQQMDELYRSLFPEHKERIREKRSNLVHMINRDIERDDLKLMFNNKNKRLNYE